MSRAFTKETAESAAPPEKMVDEGPNLVTPEDLAQIEAHVARLEAAMKTEPNVLLRETLARDLRYWEKPVQGHDGTIRTVARNITKSGKFSGEEYSAGDEFVSLCSTNEGGPGNATTWRFANMARHMTLASVGAAALRGAPFEPVRRVVVRTGSLFEPAE